ncbi:hypothetical protein Pst134EB_018479 [Puccinia striiformis f. sp. tritici]|nr:hypothetical protein Pst134EB_018479 [Puccinia striiformis f. sp. tritici]
MQLKGCPRLTRARAAHGHPAGTQPNSLTSSQRTCPRCAQPFVGLIEPQSSSPWRSSASNPTRCDAGTREHQLEAGSEKAALQLEAVIKAGSKIAALRFEAVVEAGSEISTPEDPKVAII